MPETTPLFRSFIAVPLNDELRQKILTLQNQLRSQLPELKTPKVETLHLTLHFLGDLNHQQLAEISQVMLSIGQKKKNFNVVVKELGFFPNRRRPRTLWLGLSPTEGLKALHASLTKGLVKIALPIDSRSFKPHLTIGRFRQQPRSTQPLCPFLSHSCGSLIIDRMVLYTSSLTPQGATHTPVSEALLTT